MLRIIRKRVRNKKGISSAEFLSGFRKTDKSIPLGIARDKVKEELIKNYGLTEEDAEKYLERYW